LTNKNNRRLNLKRCLLAASIVAVGLLVKPLAASAGSHAELEKIIEKCAACHGVTGSPVSDEYPILGGQQFYYLYVQLKDFKSERRSNPIMKEMVADIDKGTMKSLAQYYSKQSWPGTAFQSDPKLRAKGESAISSGQCIQCHLGTFEGNSRVPRLAGQNKKYLTKTMLDFKHKARMNAPAMLSLMESYDDASIDAVADYLAGK